MEIEKLMTAALQKLETANRANSTVSQKTSKCSKCKIELPFHPPDEWNILCESHSYEELFLKKERMRQNISAELKLAGFPKKFCAEDFRTLEWVRNYPSSRGLFLTGDVGVGKTFAMALIMRNHLDLICRFSSKYLDFPGKLYGYRRNSIWKFINFPSFIMEIQDAYKKEGESAFDMLKEAAEIPFLIIDDLGAEKMTDYVRQATYYLINEREMNERQTFITSNFSLDELNSHIDARVASRIAGMCDIKNLRNTDQRVKKMNQQEEGRLA